jgi:hypothetical protein
MLAKLIAVAIREVREELRRLDEPVPVKQDPEPIPSPLPESPEPDQACCQRDQASTTGCSTERAWTRVHDARPSVRAFGFGPER